MKPAQHAARRHASQIAHHLLFIEWSHDVTEQSIRENAVHFKRGPRRGKKGRIVCLASDLIIGKNVFALILASAIDIL